MSRRTLRTLLPCLSLVLASSLLPSEGLAAGACAVVETGLDEFSMSEGLDETQIAEAMEAWQPEARACVPAGRSLVGRVEMEIKVRCDGTVERVRLIERAGVPEPVALCLRDSLERASFPAHDMPSGFVFAYATRLSFAPIVKASARAR